MAASPAWRWGPWPRFNAAEVYAALELRQRVFVVEQACVFLDVDGRDPAAWHLFGWQGAEASAPLLAYARVFAPGAVYPEASIGRIVTAPEARGSGLGRTLMREALRRTEALAPGAPIRIGAQQRLERFYEEFGFHAAGAPYLEDGIMHVEMLRPAAGAGALDEVTPGI